MHRRRRRDVDELVVCERPILVERDGERHIAALAAFACLENAGVIDEVEELLALGHHRMALGVEDCLPLGDSEGQRRGLVRANGWQVELPHGVRTRIVGHLHLRTIRLVERLWHVVVDIDDEGAGSRRRRIAVRVGRDDDRAEVDQEVVLGASLGMIERALEVEGPAAVRVNGEREHGLAPSRGSQDVAVNSVSDGDATRGQCRRKARRVAAERERQRYIGARVEQCREAAGEAAGRGRVGIARSVDRIVIPGRIVVVAVDVVAVCDRQIVLVDEAGHQRRRRVVRMLGIGRRDDRRRKVVVDRDDEGTVGRSGGIAVCVRRNDNRAEVEVDIVLEIARRMVERADEIEGPAAIGVHGQREHRLAAG